VAWVPSVAELDGLTDDECVAALAPLFEGAPRFLAQLCAARPLRDDVALFATALRIAQAMPEAEKVELVDAHPRLGAPPASVSARSYVEQGYDREATEATAPDSETAATEAERARVATELDQLNRAYEARFGFRYCVFVAGRPRTALLPDFEAALSADRAAELTRALDAVVAIAADRWAGLRVKHGN
jgi:2-oxo-4-hydroxy-4-carboxy--5-ureidoimidazoline (OHCU) decarboxylase